MGMFSTLPAHAGTRFRDDYGAARTANLTPCRILRSFPMAQPDLVAVQGGLKHVV
ncbi:MAG: hypothetical protein QRY16_13785 [Enterobacterales bacterium endosymbiont of Blomia tropicalis]|uniref:hypothetical protein n=1 Tax=Mixta mediterraneensis TaxID=2758443 RepID=UPI00187452E9|nr:hypothetical protein [Mixta mediterraneensis]MBE5252453.1 hypothetical protein [Mixta mediterraneensis]MDL4914821.1 hypothetical protein [Mixta mediterraneensis]